MPKNEQEGTAVEPAKQKAVIQWKGEQIAISFEDVKNLICPLAANQEAAIFLKTCQSLGLNPFANQIYLIKYDIKDKAATVIAIESYLEAAEQNNNYDGCEAGIILKDSGGKLEFRDSAFLLDEEKPKLVGGWAKVFRKDRSRPTYVAVHKAECIKYTREGKPTKFWTEPKQPWMLRKTALKRALVEAFPSLFAGTLATTEVAGDIEGDFQEIPEGTLPPGLMTRDGKPNWPKVWARAKSELGLTKEQVHDLLHVKSVKKDLYDQGTTMEQIWNSLVHALQGAQMADNVVDEETGEVITREKEVLTIEETPATEPEEDDLFGEEEELEAPEVDEQLLKGWQIVKNTVNELNITDKQIRRWFAHYNIEVGVNDFARVLPPQGIDNDMLSKFQTVLDAYRERKEQGAASQ